MKNARMLLLALIVGLALLAELALIASAIHANAKVVKAAAVKTTLVETGNYSGIGRRLQGLVKNDADWQKLWDEHAANVIPPPTCPQVDFNKEMVVVVFLGDRNTGGFSVTIEAIEDDGQNLIVTYRENKPGTNDPVSLAITQPFVMVKVPLSAKPVRFVLVS